MPLKSILLSLCVILIGGNAAFCADAELSAASISIINAHEHFQSLGEVPKYLAGVEPKHVVKTVIVGSPEATIYLGRKGFLNHEKYNAEGLLIQTAYPDRFIFFPTLDVKDPNKLKKLKAYVELGARGLKLYSGHSFFYNLPLDHTGMLPVYAYCEANNIPILFHVNAGRYQEELESVLQKFPDLKVICPHYCLSTSKTERFEYLMDTYPNLYTDISFGWIDYLKAGLERFSKNPEFYRKLIEKYQDRIFFATDMVVTHAGYKTAEWFGEVTQVYKDLLEKETYGFFAMPDQSLNGLHLNRAVLEKIYHENFERFLYGGQANS